MTIKKRGLGRGLDALLGLPLDEEPAPLPAQAVTHIPIDLIQKGRHQPRLTFRAEALEELANSIRMQGVVQPVLVRPLDGGERYELIAGERRWRASQIAGLHEIPAVVREVNDSAALSIALVENIQREELNPIEEAGAFRRLLNELGMTHQEIADAVGRSRAAISNALRLLELSEPVRHRLENGDIDMGHARALLALPASAQAEAVRRIVSQGLSVRETERLVKRLQEATAAPARPPAPRSDPNIVRLEGELSERLGARVSLRHNPAGDGQMTIQYHTLDELDGILAHIK
ncbi:MAG: ParB/RepB/Spo0J family partition protein [Gammaproteobacteria bacterium]